MNAAPSSSLRILALNWRCLRHPEAGGAEVNLFEQARRWAAAGHEVTVITADPGREYAAQRDETADGVRIRRMGGRFTIYLLAALYLLLHSHEYDRILDISNGIPFFTALFARRPSVLMVHHVHDRQWFSEFPRAAAALGRFLEMRVVPFLYRHHPVIAVSPTTRDALVASGFRKEQIQIVYNGIDAECVECAYRKMDACRVAYVGRLKRYKRIERLIAAVAALRDEFPNIHLDIAGDGDARPELAATVERLGLQDHVTLYGYVDDATKEAILCSATVFATPSMHEGWGLSVIEANAHGVPAVAYNVPGLRVAIRHGETGLLAKDDNAFYRALAWMLHDRVLRDQLSTGAMNWAAGFDWDTTARATLEILREAHPPRPAGPLPHYRTA